MRNRPAFAPCHGQQRHGVGDGLADIAAAEHLRVGKAVDEIDHQQPERARQFQVVAEALALVRADLLVHGYFSSG
ncbi:hypothetical protein D1872_338450 [compost metagenome]